MCASSFLALAFLSPPGISTVFEPFESVPQLLEAELSVALPVGHEQCPGIDDELVKARVASIWIQVGEYLPNLRGTEPLDLQGRVHFVGRSSPREQLIHFLTKPAASFRLVELQLVVAIEGMPSV